MAEESEKRFNAVMDKLFHAPPKSKSSSTPTSDSGVQSRGKKRSWSSSSSAMVEQNSRSNLVGELRNQSASATAVQPPMCRPWDRSDFFRRLSTFKSMTWFAKPQAVSAINCARRGWINVDFDTIACEACGSRILVSTPQTWTQQQVEKTAIVFSLKLNSGHKLLCPWVDNICEEGLTQFPPSQTVDLVEDYKTRCTALLQILALPSISSSAISYMRTPQLDQFLKEHSTSEDSEFSGTDHISYYQAQKLISLCGWDPHPLPYTVFCKEGQKRSVSDVGSDNDSELQFDPNSVVLDCKLCGARVGLWPFSSTPRPIEILRLVGHTEVSNSDSQVATNGKNEGPAKLNLTIAGGPPPTKQNYRAVVSLPIVGRNLRARFSTTDHLSKVSEEQDLLVVSENSVREGVSEANDVPENPSTSSQIVVHDSMPSGKEKVESENVMEFDPIKQHRPFCPWITSIGNSAPGWKQTLSALQRHNEFSHTLPQNTSSSFIEVDDPIESVRMLFNPPSKRPKLARSS